MKTFALSASADNRLLTEAFLRVSESRDNWGKWRSCHDVLQLMKASFEMPSRLLLPAKLNTVLGRNRVLKDIMPFHNSPNVLGIFWGRHTEKGINNWFYYFTEPNQGKPMITFQAKTKELKQILYNSENIPMERVTQLKHKKATVSQRTAQLQVCAVLLKTDLWWGMHTGKEDK